MDNPSILLTVLVALVVSLTNIAGHFVPWHIVPGAANRHGRLRRLLAYVYGVGSIWVGMAAMTLGWSALDWAPTAPVMLGTLTVVVVAAGIGTLLAYLIDLLREHQALRQDIADYVATDQG